jgi:translation initiation factor IF-3
VRVIDENGTMLGEITTSEALRRAREVGMDLVEVDPNSRPPVCKIMDYGKFKYHESKKKHHKAPEQRLKEVRLRPKTDSHDREIKVQHAREFLEKGNKVQFTMMFRGRERSHPQVAMQAFNEILTDLEGVAKVERPPKLEGKRMTMIVMPASMASPAKPPAIPVTARPPAGAGPPHPAPKAVLASGAAAPAVAAAPVAVAAVAAPGAGSSDSKG